MSDSRPSQDDHNEDFVRLFSRHQRQIYGYIGTILHNPADVEEVLQETSLILWKKFDTFRRDESFIKWACGVAHLQVLRFFRQQKRRMLPLDEPTIERLLADRTSIEGELSERRLALAACLKKLTQKQRSLVANCYAPGIKFKDVAKAQGRTSEALYQTLSRIRRSLFECVNRTVAAQGRKG